MNVLIVEDHAKVARGIREALRRDEYAVNICGTARETRMYLKSNPVDLLILDLGLPDGDGLDLMQDIHEHHGDIPVLILTARDSVDDRVRGLDEGAEDYLIKPFAVPELQARVRRILRKRVGAEQILRCGPLELDVLHRTAQYGAEELDLSPREFSLLQYLMEQQGRIVARSMIAEDVWQTPNRFTPIDNVIEVCVSRLRDKIDRGREVKMLLTVRGAGYMLRVPE